MRGALKVLVWVVVLAACAGVGAFIASRSNPFPPGVEDPGARPSGPTGGTGPAQVPWAGSAIVRTTHELFVGGSCRTAWRLRVSVLEEGDRLSGSGSATLAVRERCDFPTAQLQIRHVRLSVEGRVRGTKLTLRLEEVDRRPVGSIDLGGLVPLIGDLRIELRARGGTAAGSLDVRAPDGDHGSYTIAGDIELVRRP